MRYFLYSFSFILCICMTSKSWAVRPFETIPVLSPLAEGKFWYLKDNLLWRSAKGKQYCVPKYFVTDLTSIPRPFWAILPTWEGYGPAAIVHDHLYWVGGDRDARKEADLVMLEAMRDQGVGWVKRHFIYLGVRIGGGFSWWINGLKYEDGERRVIPKLHIPKNATETWKTLSKKIGGYEYPPQICV